MAAPPPPPPPPGINTIVIEGDSLTNATPGVIDSSYYSGAYIVAHPEKTWFNRAQGSRVVQDYSGSNGLVNHLAEDLSYDPDLVYAQIGANDLTGSGGKTAEQHRDAVLGWAANFSAVDVPVILGTVTQADQRIPGYANLQAQAPIYNGYIRAAVGNGIAAIVDFAGHPVLADPAYWATYTDGIHWSHINPGTPYKDGHDYALDVFKAVFDPILAGAAGNVPAFALPADQAGSPADADITGYFIVTGMGMGEKVTLSVAGAGAQFKHRYQGAFGVADLPDVMNGDAIMWKLRTSAAAVTPRTIEISGGGFSDSFTATTGTGAQATYQHLDIYPVNFTGFGTEHATRTINGLVAPEAGFFLVTTALTGNGTVKGVNVTVAGTPVTWLADNFSGELPLRMGIVAVTAGTKSAVVADPNNSALLRGVVSFTFVKGINPAPAAGQIYKPTPGYFSDPQAIPSVDQIAGGLTFGTIAWSAGSAGSVLSAANAKTTIIDYGEVAEPGDNRGQGLALLTEDGDFAFNLDGFGLRPMIAISFAPA